MIGNTLQHKKWFSIVLSALLLNATFFWPATAHVLVFLFLLPTFLFDLAYPKTLSYKEGFVWSALFYSLHFWGFFVLFSEKAEGLFRFFVTPLFVTYFSLYAGVWFFAANKCSQLSSSQVWHYFSWIMFTFSYFAFMRKLVLWPFGQLKGYCFALPLLPLASHSQWISLLPLFKWQGLLAAQIMFSALCARAIYHRSWALIWLSVVFFAPFLCGWIQHKKSNLVAPKNIGYVQPPSTMHPLDRAQEIDDAILDLLELHPEVELIVMPETSYPFSLNKLPEIVTLWSCNALSEGAHLLIGAHRNQEGATHNSLFLIDAKTIKMYYDKTTPMLLTEYVPFPWDTFNCVTNLFLKDKKEFSSSNKNQVSIRCNNFSFAPCICSDLFFDQLSEIHCISKNILLCTVNDSWFSTNYLRNLMYLFAKMTAMELDQNMIYIGHYQAVWIERGGDSCSLSSQ